MQWLWSTLHLVWVPIQLNFKQDVDPTFSTLFFLLGTILNLLVRLDFFERRTLGTDSTSFGEPNTDCTDFSLSLLISITNCPSIRFSIISLIRLLNCPSIRNSISFGGVWILSRMQIRLFYVILTTLVWILGRLDADLTSLCRSYNSDLDTGLCTGFIWMSYFDTAWGYVLKIKNSVQYACSRILVSRGLNWGPTNKSEVTLRVGEGVWNSKSIPSLWGRLTWKYLGLVYFNKDLLISNCVLQ